MAPAVAQASGAGDLISFDDAPADSESAAEPAVQPAQPSSVEAATGDLLDGRSTPAVEAPESEEVAPGQLRPIVVVGPSGVGKGTLIARLMKNHGEHFGFTVRAFERGWLRLRECRVRCGV